MQYLPQRLGPKLNLSLLVFFLLLGGATGALVFFGFQRTQDNATELSREGLELQGSETLQRLADQTSFSSQLIVQQATTDASSAANYLARSHQLGASVPWDPAIRLQQAPNGTRIDPSSARITDVWVPSTLPVDDQLATNLRDSATLDALFPTLLRGNTDAVAIYYITPQGASRHFPPFGVHNDLPADFDFYSQRGFEPFRSGVTAPTRALWTAPYESPAGQGLIITALSPVFEDGVYRGVIGVDLAVPRLVARIDEVRYTPGGYAFVIDRDGEIMPSRFSDDVAARVGGGNEELNTTLQAMRDGKVGFDRVPFGNDDVIIAYAPLGELGGSLALVSPVDELTVQAAAITSSIDEQGDRTLAFILATMLGFFIAGLLATAWFNRRLLTRPVSSLVTGTRAVAAGNYNVRIPIESNDELGMLADSFNIMIEQIDIGQQRLEQRNRELQSEVSERARVEEELRRSEDLYRTLARNFPNGSVVLFDRDLRFQIVDGQAIVSLGLVKEEMEGKTTAELFPPRTREQLEPPMRRVFDGQTSVFEATAPGGRVFVAYTLPLYNEHGEIFAGMAMTQEITERKRAEVELAEREAQYRSIFESVSDGLIITDPDGAIVEVNPAFAAIHGYTRDEMLAMQPLGFIDPGSHHLFDEYTQAIGEGGTYRARAINVRKDGSTFPVEVFGRPVMYRGTRHVMGVVRDITEQVGTERLLEQRVEERTREIAALLDISHAVTSTLELRSLVAVILQQLQQVVEYNAASVLLREGDVLRIMEFDERIMGRPATDVRLEFRIDDAELLWRRALQRQPVIIDDIHDASEAAAAFRQAVGEHLTVYFGHIRSLLLVPLTLQDDVIGLVAISHGATGYFSEHNAALVMAVANHAGVAIENARLFERVEQRTRELSTLLGLSHSVASTLSLNDLVPIILENLQSVIPYMGASILLRENDELAIVTYDPTANTTAPRQSPLRFQLDESLPLWQIMLRHEAALIPDVHDDTPLARSFRQTVGQNIVDATFDLVNGMLVAPLASQGVVIGVIALTHVETGFFTKQHASLAMTVANQAAVAIQNARLFESVEERTRELSTLLDVSHDVTSTLELDPLLCLILDQVKIVVDYDRASVMFVEGNELVVAAVSDLDNLEGVAAAPGTRYPIDLESAAMKRLRKGRPIIVDDVQSDSDAARGYRSTVSANLDTLAFRGWMGVPLVQGDRLIGMLALAKFAAGYYTERHGKLAAAIANQAAVALDNARLYADSEARSKELAALLDVSTAVASTLDLRTLLRVILEQAQHVLEYDRASVTLATSDELTIFAVLNADGDEQRSNTPPGTTFKKSATGSLWPRLEGGDYVIIDDVLSDEPMAAEYRSVVSVDRDPGIHSWLGVPLASQDGVAGILSFRHHEKSHYTERHARLAMAIANQAAVAMENARLFDSVEQRTRELSALLDVSHSVAATLDLRELVGLILDQLKLVSEYSGSSLLTVEGDQLVVLESRGPFGPENDIEGMSFPLQIVPNWWDEMKAGRHIVIHDVRDDSPAAVSYREAIGANIEHPAFSYVRSWMAVPLMLQDRPVGMLSVSRDQPRYFNEGHVRIARAVADQAAIAIENARLYQQGQQFAAVEERQRLARELHDSVSQALYGIALGARTARTLLDRDPARAVDPVEYVLQLAEAGLTEMRALIFELRPESLENEGLVAAIEKQVSATRARYGVNVEADLCEEPPVPIEIKEAVFRVVQESLHNIVKHAHAQSVDVRLACNDDEITLEVNDDGVGFESDGSFPGHMGLKSMRERTLKFGGVTTIDSAPGEGTRIRVRIPLQEPARPRSAATTRS